MELSSDTFIWWGISVNGEDHAKQIIEIKEPDDEDV